MAIGYFFIFAVLGLTGCQMSSYLGEPLDLPKGQDTGIVKNVSITTIGAPGKAFSDYTMKEMRIGTYGSNDVALDVVRINFRAGDISTKNHQWLGANAYVMEIYDGAPADGAPRIGVWSLDFDWKTGKIIRSDWKEDNP